MSTISVFFVADAHEAQAVVERLEAAFADDGYPIDQLLMDKGARRRVEVLFWDRSEETALNAVQSALAGWISPQQLRVARLGDHNWVAKSLEGLAPIWAARVVVHGQHDRGRIAKTALAIEIEAAQAFGSGHHGSTVGCLLAMQRHLQAEAPQNPLDLGTGTGVLAIALAKLSRRPVIATDIDPLATVTASQNARNNAVGPLVKCLTADGPNHKTLTDNAPYDLIMANILARPLTNMASGVANLATRNATLILSGLQPTDKNRILSAYGRYGFRCVRADKVDEWLTLTLRRVVYRSST